MWDAKQVRIFVRDVMREAGPGWGMFGERIQRALIAEKALAVLGNQDREAVPVDAMHWLLGAMLREAHLEDA